MKINNFKKKVASLGILGMMALPLVLPGISSAHVRGANVRMQHYIFGSNEVMSLRTDRLNNTVSLDQNFLMNNGFYGQRLLMRGVLGDVTARRVVVVDNSNSNNVIILSNNLTGPGSTNINSVVLRVNHSFFDQLTNNINANEDINISVNTGNNTVAFNTVAGNLTTGDVSIVVR